MSPASPPAGRADACVRCESGCRKAGIVASFARAYLAAAHGDGAAPAVNDRVEDLLRGVELRQELGARRYGTAVAVGGGRACRLVAGGLLGPEAAQERAHRPAVVSRAQSWSSSTNFRAQTDLERTACGQNSQRRVAQTRGKVETDWAETDKVKRGAPPSAPPSAISERQGRQESASECARGRVRERRDATSRERTMAAGAAGAASAPSAAAARQHYSGLWIGESHPAAGSEHDVPVNPIKWSLSLCPGWRGSACAGAMRGGECGGKTRHRARAAPQAVSSWTLRFACASDLARARARRRQKPNSSPFAARLPCLPQEQGRCRRLAQAFLTMQVRLNAKGLATMTWVGKTACAFDLVFLGSRDWDQNTFLRPREAWRMLTRKAWRTLAC